MDIYPAGETPIPGVHARDLAEGVAAHGHREVHYLGSDRAAVVRFLKETVRPGDLVECPSVSLEEARSWSGRSLGDCLVEDPARS